ncbi:MAG TPA: DUF3592 domain-containing protein [Verrucomicrobiae bacterium]|nr:DUF3592 domain-containing protein [Verrucomicrobiae bacterium]
MTPHNFGLIALPFCSVWAIWALNKARKAMATRRWTKVPCTVASLEIVPQSSRISDKEAFSVRTEYSYRVNETSYTSDTVTNSHAEFLSKEEVQALTARLPQGSVGVAYYNPKRPQQAVLVPGADLAAAKELLMALGGICLAVFLLTR